MIQPSFYCVTCVVKFHTYVFNLCVCVIKTNNFCTYRWTLISTAHSHSIGIRPLTFLPNGTNGFAGNINTTHNQQHHTFGPHQVPSPQPTAGLIPGFNNDVLFAGSQFNGGSRFPFGLNGHFNSSNQNGAANNLTTDWNIAYRLPRFNGPLNPQQPIVTLPLNNVGTSIVTSNLPLQSSTSVSNVCVNPNGGVNAVQIANEKSNEMSSVKSEKMASNDTGDKAKEDMTTDLALKLSMILVNPTMLQSAISQINNSEITKKDMSIDLSSDKSPATSKSDDNLHFTSKSILDNETDEVPVSCSERQLETVRYNYYQLINTCTFLNVHILHFQVT